MQNVKLQLIEHQARSLQSVLESGLDYYDESIKSPFNDTADKQCWRSERAAVRRVERKLLAALKV